MSKKNSAGSGKPEITKQSEYYKLNTKAVDDLVTADESNSPPVSEEELRSYLSGPKFHITAWARTLFIKAWFPAAVCFFFLWGLGGYVADLLDLLLITGLAMGMVTDLLTNNVLRFFDKTPGQSDRWIMVTRRGYLSFPLNILYAFVVLFLVYTLYNIINLALMGLLGLTDTVPLGVEPILFGLFYMGIDLALIRAKHLLADILRSAKRSARP